MSDDDMRLRRNVGRRNTYAERRAAEMLRDQHGVRPIVVVTGGRTFSDVKYVEEVLWRYKPALLFHGGATGVDRLASAWAERYQVDQYVCEARWWLDKKAAGPKRNRRMLEMAKRIAEILNLPIRVLVFDGGAGTMNCAGIAKRMDLDTIDVSKRRKDAVPE